jgi:hypothetical protein
MTPDLASERDAIAFGEKVLALLEQGAFTATYKYAVLLALIDACLEHTDGNGAAPTELHPRHLRRRVVELYWPHTRPFGDAEGGAGKVLRQSSVGTQARIVSLIGGFRDAVAAPDACITPGSDDGRS